jgi:succinylglutamate desuccinylase
MVVECGQHFLRSASELATAVTYDFLAYFGLVDKDPATPVPEPQRRFQLLQTHVIKSADFAFVRPLIGFETFAKGELIATNGAEEIRALCDDCTIFMPAQRVIVGREAVYLTKPI